MKKVKEKGTKGAKGKKAEHVDAEEGQMEEEISSHWGSPLNILGHVDLMAFYIRPFINFFFVSNSDGLLPKSNGLFEYISSSLHFKDAPFVPSSFVVRPGAPSSVLAPRSSAKIGSSTFVRGFPDDWCCA